MKSHDQGDKRRRGDTRAAVRSSRGHTDTQETQEEFLVIHGWTVVAHPLFVQQMTKLAEAADHEQRDASSRKDGSNTKLLGHLRGLDFDGIPIDPAHKDFRHDDSLGKERKHWFRGTTGDGRYRLFFRYHSSLRIIILAWVNDADSLRAYGSATDAY